MSTKVKGIDNIKKIQKACFQTLCTSNYNYNSYNCEQNKQTNTIQYPVRLCRPAPTVDNKDPTNMTHLFGHAKPDTNNDPPMLSPNLK